jgi:hypothetical protein
LLTFNVIKYLKAQRGDAAFAPHPKELRFFYDGFCPSFLNSFFVSNLKSYNLKSYFKGSLSVVKPKFISQ